MTVALLVAAGASGGARVAGAQATRPDVALPAFSNVYLETGTLLMDVSKLNPHFERLDLDAKDRPGYFTISNDAYAVGAGGYGIVMNRVGLGAEFASADIGSESSPSGKTNALTTSYWMGTVGYAMFTSWRLNIMPFVGIGAGTARLTLRDRNGGASPSAQDPAFDDIIAAPGEQSTMTGSYTMVQPGLAIDYIVLPTNSTTMGVTFGLRLASAISPNRTTWKYGGQTVFGGPDLGPTGGVIRVLVGFGGFRLSK
ncbi:MAG TPA: hypothetical protein VG916_13630 [Gemmatimonadaceae bacterium]|nr:hypothetical protein [Gemmatimonadaceae bacterium]